MNTGYKGRVFYNNPLYQILYEHFESFMEVYNRFYKSKYGPFRKVIERTINKFIKCGDPRYGVAVFECDECKDSHIAVPFSCKTRLFCSSCHAKTTIIWVDHLIENVMADVPHRFFTFSIPKMLRPYFAKNRKLQSLLVDAANKTLCLALNDGKIVKRMRPGIIALIQSHGDELNANPHLHQVVSDGLFDYRNSDNITFHACNKWDLYKITKLFRQTLLELMVKNKVLSTKIADNLLSWKNMGFHVHASEPFGLDDREGLVARLSYAGRPPVAVSRLEYKDNIVYYKTKNGKTLTFSPLDFIAKITSHIPDHYQNVRRYCGFYASNVQRTLPKTENKEDNNNLVTIDDDKPVNTDWATLIARIYGEIPTICPKCGKIMRLKDFIKTEDQIYSIVPWSKRAPPKIEFPKFDDVSGNIEYEYDEYQEAVF